MTNIHKCGIVGCGNVGATTAYALMQTGFFSEMVLIDINGARAEGEAADLSHGMPFLSPTEIYAGDYADLAGADLVIIAAGAAQREGETRLDLIHKNERIFESVVTDICRYNNEAILLVVTNPVDILTEYTRRISGLPVSQVIGSGTVLDTARLKFLLGRHLGVDARQVHAFIIGEHGDSELPVFSSANISGVDLDAFCHSGCDTCTPLHLDRLFCETRDAAYHIIKAKGATYYAIAEAVRRIVTAIVRDEAAILPISVCLSGEYGQSHIAMSIPTVVGRVGAQRILEIPLSGKERELLERSAAQMHRVLGDLETAAT
ncbi:MAG: L-lactate dehydrogenase [Clostridia bacterium]|nr:L-lactate dehydrogenase [Clostridia bacterium]